MLLTLFIVSACARQPVSRVPASFESSISCLKLHQSILRRVNDSFELVNYNGLSDMPKNIVEVAESFDDQGIDYQFVKRLDDNLLGIEILPNDHGLINRYVKQIHKRFDGVRVFYIDTPESNTLGSFTPMKNYIFLGKGVSTKLSSSGYTTLSHEARHAYFTSRILRYMSGSYKGKITATKGIIKGSGNFSYTQYMSFQEVKTFKEDARKFFDLWLNEFVKEKNHNKLYWDRFVYKTRATLSYLDTTKYYLEEMMNAIVDDSIKFESQMGVVHASKEVTQDSDNIATVRLALNQHYESTTRSNLKQGTIEQINKELDQLFIDQVTLSSQKTFFEEVATFTNRNQLTFYSLFAKRNSLVNAREIRLTRLQDLINQHHKKIFKDYGFDLKDGSDANALQLFSKIVKDSVISVQDNIYTLNFKNNQMVIRVAADGETLELNVIP